MCLYLMHDTIYESSQSCNRLHSACHEFGVTLCMNQLVKAVILRHACGRYPVRILTGLCDFPHSLLNVVPKTFSAYLFTVTHTLLSSLLTYIITFNTV